MLESAEEFVRLRTSTDPEEYGKAATDEAAVSTWIDVIERYPDMRFWVAQNKTVPVAILERLATDDDPKVRSMVARKGKLEPRLLEQMASDPNDAVRMAVARHRNTPPDVLVRLAQKDAWSEVRNVARKRVQA
jgi:hypothetical protein